MEAFHIVSRLGTSFAVLAGPDGAAEGAGVAEEEGEESGCFVEEPVGEGRSRCSWERVGMAVERSGRSLAVRSPGRIVEEGNQEMLAEEAGRQLFREHHATGSRLWNIHTVPTVWGGWSMDQ